MLLELTISQLDIGPVPADEAQAMGQLGYMQWIAGLPGDVSYPCAARHALRLAAPFAQTSPAVTVFCDLVQTSLAHPCIPLELAMPPRKRRGGATTRRSLRQIR